MYLTMRGIFIHMPMYLLQIKGYILHFEYIAKRIPLIALK